VDAKILDHFVAADSAMVSVGIVGCGALLMEIMRA
jgi:hypothetical protein